MESLTLFEEKIPYTVKKLIAVNSITYCYIELEIDRHCALFGRNNVGKTSLLNALKLHFFPEISFNDCKNKFTFKSSKGELYSSEDSYAYYFPSDSSFLILEAENIHGCFSIILFKSNSSFGYQRLALPCEYAEIRQHFWDIDKVEVNNGLGSPVSDLGIAKIHVLFQQYQKQGAVILKTSKEIKERLFNHSPMNRDKGRYCLVPMKDGGKERELSAFRQLMNFTFEIAKTETKGLTETFSTIIESGKINVRDELHQDLQAILVVRLNSLAQGFSGVRYQLLKQITLLLQQDILPLIPEEGSVGASGDLTPLSYLAAVVAGERDVFYKNKTQLTDEVFTQLNIAPLTLKPKEGLAIMNGTAVMTAVACLAFQRAEYLSQRG